MSGGEEPGRWRIFVKINENSKENYKIIEFYKGKFQYFWSFRAPGAKPPDVGEFLKKVNEISIEKCKDL